MSEQETKSNIIEQTISTELKDSYMAYAMSVIVGRAIPDVRDGLKPVHRRILYSMLELGLQFNKPYKKSARIVGEVLGKYHPHGDTAVYDALVRMAQEFSLRYPLVRGQGNFGSIDGDRAAAMRYCVTGDSLILTDKGLVPIESISSKEEDKISLSISSMNTKNNLTDRFFNSGEHRIIDLRTEKGFGIKGSYNHPLLCLTQKDSKPTVEWKLLEEISKDDYVILNRESNLFSKTNEDLKKYYPDKKLYRSEISLPTKMSEDLAFLLGALTAEGSLHQKQILFNNKDMSYYKKVKETIKKIFPENKIYEREVKGNCKEISIYNQKVVQFLLNLGLGTNSNNKQIPNTILKSKENIITSFLIGLFEGDGSVSFKRDKIHNGASLEIAYHSNSKKLIEELKIILLNYGILTTKPYKDKRCNCLKIQITGVRSQKQFFSKIGFFSTKKKNELKNVLSINENRMSKTDYIPYLADYLRKKYKNKFIAKNNIDRYNKITINYPIIKNMLDKEDKILIESLLKNNYAFDKVESVKKSKKKEIVYSVRVKSECHSYTANGLINHNTEAKMSKIAEEMLIDIDKDTVDFGLNFDNSLKEPIVLPSKIPNLLVNGSSGIAVGMATNIPTHNLTEVCDSLLMLIDDPETEIKDIMEHIKGPDFPTGATIINASEMPHIYSTGRGSVYIRSNYHVEDKGKVRKIVFSELPYKVNKANMLIHIAKLVNAGIVKGIRDIRDESDKDGIRVVIELQQVAEPEIVANNLFKHTELETSFPINMLVLDKNKPKLMNIKGVLAAYLEHRVEVTIRKLEYEIQKLEKKLHLLEGLMLAISALDETIELIKSSKDPATAKQKLMDRFSIDEVQAQAILDMKLQKLTGLEIDKLKTEYEETKKIIEEYKSILADREKLMNLIKDEINEIKDKYGDSRKTQTINAKMTKNFNFREFVKNKTEIVLLTDQGYIKRMSAEEYRVQNRAGKGIRAVKMEDDKIRDFAIANTHDVLYLYTNKGRLFTMDCYGVPQASRNAKGRYLANFLKLDKDETINNIMAITEDIIANSTDYMVTIITQKGKIKRMPFDYIKKIRSNGLRVVTLNENDKVVAVKLLTEEKKIMITSFAGKTVVFDPSKVRPMGRVAMGVKAMNTDKSEIVSVNIVNEEDMILFVSKKGFGKKTFVSEFRETNRGTKGVKAMNTKTAGGIVKTLIVTNNEEIMIITDKGIAIRTTLDNIPTLSRNTKGVKLISLDKDDYVHDINKMDCNMEDDDSEEEVSANE